MAYCVPPSDEPAATVSAVPVTVKLFGIVTLLGKEIVTELLQNNMKPKKIAKEIDYLLSQEGKKTWEKNYSLLVSAIDANRKKP